MALQLLWSAHTRTDTHTRLVIHTSVPAYCLPSRNIRGSAKTPVGSICRSNRAELQHISDPDLQRPLCPNGAFPNLAFTEWTHHALTLVIISHAYCSTHHQAGKLQPRPFQCTNVAECLTLNFFLQRCCYTLENKCNKVVFSVKH